MLYLGSHVSFGKDQLLGATKEALKYGANTFMFYTGAPTNTIRKEVEEKYISDAIKLMEENEIDINKVVCHAPYIVNLANRTDESKYEFSIDFIRRELKRCDEMHIKQMVLHPGNAVNGMDKQEALLNIATAINVILDGTTKCKILLETMAGKGTECCSNIDEMAFLIENIIKKDQIGVCIDTCHISDAGYDIKNFESYLDEFDKKIGLSYVGCIHVNDSKNPVGAHKDRHANIGKGYIGFDNLLNVIYNDRLEGITRILETPYIGETDEAKERLYAPYKEEIEMIKARKFNENIFEDIRNNAHKK